ncbi:MAG: exopolysaccharide biosynthesis protein [Alphaproteobacteria bacterium]|nr:exopolysaccharide biosynthesis protein [Alphaproteobacteria bacterium]
MASAYDPQLKIQTLQAGRAIAALVVLFFHIQIGVETYIAPLPDALSAALAWGYLGVDFFFVLSGFIIYHVNAGSKPGGDWLRRYAGARLTRIYLPYFPIGIGMALIYSILPGLSDAHDRHWDWFTTLTLFPGTSEPALNIAWTLCHEIGFYAVFALSFLVGRPILGVTTWVAVIAAAHLLLPQPGNILLLRPVNIEFLFGMLAAMAVRCRQPKSMAGHMAVIAPAAVAALLLTLFVLAGGPGAGEQKDSWVRLLFGAAIAAAIVPIVRAELAGKLRIPFFLLVLGEASYALYLVHNPIVSLVVRLSPQDWRLAVVISLIVTVATALAFHFCYEKPAIQRARRLWRARPSR